MELFKIIELAKKEKQSLMAAIKGYEDALERKKQELDDYATQRKKTIDSYTKKIKDVKKKHGI